MKITLGTKDLEKIVKDYAHSFSSTREQRSVASLGSRRKRPLRGWWPNVPLGSGIFIPQRAF
jgi:hypothetical protein